MNNDQIIQKIKNENLRPVSKTFFLFKKIITWFLLVITTIFGAYSFALFFIKTIYIDFENWRYFSNSYNGFILSKIPIIWIILFVISMFLVFYLFKHTNKGYKYSITLVAFISLFISFSLGIFLSKVLVQNARFIEKIEKEKIMNWMNPESGRISGEVLFIDRDFILIRDIKNNVWNINISYILDNSRENIENNKIVSIVGQYDYENNFTACQIIPLNIDNNRFKPDLNHDIYQKKSKENLIIKDICDFVINHK